jgi:hypothetical protein
MMESSGPGSAAMPRSAAVVVVCGSLLPDVRRQEELEELAEKLEMLVEQGWEALSSGPNAEALQAYAAELREVDQLLTAVVESTHGAAVVLQERIAAVLWNILTEETGLKRADVLEWCYERTDYVVRIQLEEITLVEPKPYLSMEEPSLMLRGPRVNAKGKVLKRTEGVFIENFDKIAHLPCVKRPAV